MTLRKKPSRFERGVVTLTLDTEQIWGCERRTSATWSVVGALSLTQSQGPLDHRFLGLPPELAGRIRSGNEISSPNWYARSFVKRLRDADPCQEVGLHGGLTHLCWSAAGITEEIGVTPTSFTFPRAMEARHDLLPQYGIRCHGGLPGHPDYKLPRTLPGAAMQAVSELIRITPPTVRPVEQRPGPWSIPSSLFLYRMLESRARIVPFSTRLARVRLGIESAARSGRILHYCLHPENLAEPSSAFSVFEEVVSGIARARQAEDVEVLTMTEIVDRMESRPAGRKTREHVAAMV